MRNSTDPEYQVKFPDAFYDSDNDENEDVVLSLEYDVLQEGDVKINLLLSQGDIVQLDYAELFKAILNTAVQDGEQARLALPELP